MDALLPAPRLGPILKIVDRVQHPSTPWEEKQTYLETLNRLCGNKMFSDIIEGCLKLRPGEVRKLLEPVDISPLQQVSEVNALLTQIRILEEQNSELVKRVAAIAQEAGETPVPKPENGYYSMEAFVAALIAAKGGRSYGWKNDYVEATHITPGAKPVEHQHIQRWQKDQMVPAFAFEQIKTLQFRKRIGKKSPRWSEEEYRWFAGVVNANPKMPNAKLARMCSERFGRPITENAIKGAKFRALRAKLIHEIIED